MEKQSQVIKDIFVSCAGKQELKIILIELTNLILKKILFSSPKKA